MRMASRTFSWERIIPSTIKNYLLVFIEEISWRNVTRILFGKTSKLWTALDRFLSGLVSFRLSQHFDQIFKIRYFRHKRQSTRKSRRTRGKLNLDIVIHLTPNSFNIIMKFYIVWWSRWSNLKLTCVLRLKFWTCWFNC